MAALLSTCAVLLCLVCVLYKFLTRNLDYWKKRDVAHEQPLPLIGNLWMLLTLQTPIGAYLKDIYDKYPEEKVVGIFLGHDPCLVVRDPVTNTNILGKDCDYFAKNIFVPHPDIEPILARSLFPLHGIEWKMLRSRLSPNFNTIKLGNVFPAIDTVAQHYLQKIEADGVIECKILMSSYTVDVISHAVLGQGINALHDPEDRLRRVSREIAGEDWISALRNNLSFSIPGILHFLRLGLFPESSFQTMREVVWEAVQERQVDDSRDDFLGYLLSLREKGGWTLPNGNKRVLEGDYFVSQVLMFMEAGFSTTTASLLGCLYEVSKSPRVQDELRREIDETFDHHEDIEFAKLKEMSYLNSVVLEALRMHPGFPFIDRICTRDYKLPGSDIVVEKDTKVFVPIMGLHFDETCWPNPEEFLPERFLGTSEATKPYYMPFGHGPKTCLGQRFAVLVMKALLVRLMRTHRLRLASPASGHLTPNPRRFHLFPVEDVQVALDPCLHLRSNG